MADVQIIRDLKKSHYLRTTFFHSSELWYTAKNFPAKSTKQINIYRKLIFKSHFHSINARNFFFPFFKTYKIKSRIQIFKQMLNDKKKIATTLHEKR